MQRGDFIAAERAFQDAVHADPQNAHVWKALGVAFAAQGIHDRASQPFEKACELDPREPDACYYLARNHYLLNRFAESLAMFDRLANASKSDWRFANGRGLALLALGRYSDAEGAFQTAIKLERGEASLDEKPAINLGSLYTRSGQPEKARAVLRGVVKENPAAARGWFELGKVELQLGDLPSARDALENALRTRTGNREAHLLLSKVYARLGDTEKAASHREQGLAIPR